MTTLPFFIIPKYHPKTREVVLFLPDCPAPYGHILAYTRLGKTEVKPMLFFRACTLVPTDKGARHALARLLLAYSGSLDVSERVELRRRDCLRFQRTRWAMNQKGAA